MKRILLAVAACGLLCAPADAGCKGLFKKLNPFKAFKKKANPSAPAASDACETTWAAQPVPAVTAAGAFSIECRDGRCYRVRVKAK